MVTGVWYSGGPIPGGQWIRAPDSHLQPVTPKQFLVHRSFSILDPGVQWLLACLLAPGLLIPPHRQKAT